MHKGHSRMVREKVLGLITGEWSVREKVTIRTVRKKVLGLVTRENGQLSSKGNYKNGKREGAWVGYHDNGQLS